MSSITTDKESRFHTLLEAVPNGILAVDEFGKIVLCNTEAERMFGYGQGELVGKEVEILVPPEVRAGHPALRQQFHKNPVKRQMGAGRDLIGIRKDGTEFPVEIGLNPMKSETGLFVIASIVDITERKHGEEKLHKAYKELQQRNQEMEQFVYTVSHDLRSPLVTTMGFVSFLKEDIAEGNLTEVDDALARIEKANFRMQQLINDLLQLSRAGRMELNLEAFSVGSVLTGVLEYVSQIAEAKGVRIEIADDFPVITADRNRLHQVFENLLTNAVKYGSGASDPRVRVFWKDMGDEIYICVQDNGPGIAPEDHKKVFGLFQRLNTTEPGTGVGLAIVSRIVELHEGKAWVESVPGEGASFWVSLPKIAKPAKVL